MKIFLVSSMVFFNKIGHDLSQFSTSQKLAASVVHKQRAGHFQAIELCR